MNTNNYLEEWRDIRGLTSYFQVSSSGGVRNKKTGTILKPFNSRGYDYVILEVADGEFRFRRGVAIHRLVAQEFVENRLKRPEVNHIDGQKLNNKRENLEWVDRKENMRHARAMGLMRENPIGNRKFSDDRILKVFELRKEKDLMHKEIAEKLGMGVSTVTHILNGTRRKSAQKSHTRLLDEYKSVV